MDFIEAWLGVSPDGGDGSLELVYLTLASAAVALWLARRRIAGRWVARRSRPREHV
jgi:hypothetical protein